ncbi:MAG: hypothetical protein DI533_01015 [Cereibacter sphaeroides]|uniref:Uncharacterized protein n=1 Tax=Cereibacter sphaeroides TaxID=1063 RepID=A0A2W5UT20_CERSP|nr:MAG: hypothetical protein DI533_01015 [Cereibacter sphaeroides]
MGVMRRRVFYIPGYDPFPPRRYRELYRSEGTAQAAISGYRIDVSRPLGAGPHEWEVTARIGASDVTSRFEVLVWADLVRGSMAQGIPATYWQLLRTALIYLSSGALFRLTYLRKGPVIAALYPIVMLLAQALAGLFVALTVVHMVNVLAGLVGLQAPWIFGFALGLVPASYLLRWFRLQDHQLFAYYLMHDYAFTALGQGANPPVLEERMTEFRKTISAALIGDWDEVLVVGHSSGAHLGVSILADLLREGLPPGAPPLSFLTLGQVIPMVSFLPRAYRLRADLHDLAARPEITWVDVTAPGDGCAFALCDPVAVTGVSPKMKLWPLVISAAFTRTLSPERWQKLRWRFFRLHFQYLCAFDRPGDYDYFRITAGPLTLGERFAGRQPSKSRIDVPVSGHVSRSA